MAKVEFHFDFGSPNAYLAHLVVPEIERRTGVEFEYVPILLGVFKLTNNRSPMEKLAGIKNRLEYEQLEVRRFIRRHGITQFTWNPFFPVNTLLVMRGAVAAQLDGVFDRYVDAVFKAMWAEQKKMDDPEIAAAALQQAGSKSRAQRPWRTPPGRTFKPLRQIAALPRLDRRHQIGRARRRATPVHCFARA
jgi:2-hydroxychromene-2-carboxylate isomerase